MTTEPNGGSKMYYQYDLIKSAELVHHYITNMVDENNDYLPYWLLLPTKKPAEAAHCRVDDAELVGSWYEGLCAAMEMLGTTDGDTVKQALRRHLMKSWGDHGLRFCEKYPWTHTVHASFHEMGYILPAMNKITEEYPEDEKAEELTANLIKGMRGLVIERKVRTFWSGDSYEQEPVYEFPNDVYLKDGGFDLTRHTGRGEQPIRNALMVPALVRRYELKNDEVALDLAVGLTNHVLGVARYFNWKMEYFGHVHSAMCFAGGVVRLGKVLNNESYIKAGKGIYDYTRSLSSSFGWVPEYAQWHPMEEEHCETCCIRDMIICALELIGCGYKEYWNDVNMFARNQLVENQVTYTGYVECDNSKPDADGITYHDIDKRMKGGFTGGSEPNSISLERFRSIAGCCVGTAPVALKAVWDNVTTEENEITTVNIPCDKETEKAGIRSYIPNSGLIVIKAKVDGKFGLRHYEWLKGLKCRTNGTEVEIKELDGISYVSLNTGDEAEFSFDIQTIPIKETVRGSEYVVYYRACDVVDITPRGEHVRLYQRDSNIPKYYPTPEDVKYTGAANYGPTQMKK